MAKCPSERCVRNRRRPHQLTSHHHHLHIFLQPSDSPSLGANLDPLSLPAAPNPALAGDDLSLSLSLSLSHTHTCRDPGRLCSTSDTFSDVPFRFQQPVQTREGHNMTTRPTRPVQLNSHLLGHSRWPRHLDMLGGSRWLGRSRRFASHSSRGGRARPHGRGSLGPSRGAWPLVSLDPACVVAATKSRKAYRRCSAEWRGPPSGASMQALKSGKGRQTSHSEALPPQPRTRPSYP